MAKGDYDRPEAVTVRSEEEESAARAEGYVSGHEFYGKRDVDPANLEAAGETTEPASEKADEGEKITPCHACNGTGKDPNDKRRKCPDCNV